MFFSIIIPYYNTSKNIFHETLFSIFNQKEKNCQFEIIIIDNGSKKPLKIDDLNFEFKEKIKIIRLEKNLTIGPARNIGIKNSIGEWIFFLDSDDILDINFFQIIKKTIEENINCEQIKFKHKIFKNKKIENNPNNENPEYTKNNDFSIFNSISVWTSIYKKKFLVENDIFFINKKQNFEDIFFTLVAISLSELNKSLVLINNVLINYRISEFQTLYKFSKRKKSERINLMKESKLNIILALEFLEKRIHEKIFKLKFLVYMISLYIHQNIQMLFYYKNKEIYEKIKCYLKKIKNLNIPFINKLIVKLFKFRLLFYLSCKIYSMLKKILFIGKKYNS